MTEATTFSNKLKGKVAIITGGASGFGEATARLFVNEGARMVVIADIQDQLGQSVASSIGPEFCTYIHCDVTDEDQVKSMVVSTVKNYGCLDIMFSNAGMVNQRKSILELDLSAMERLFAVNVRGMAACVKYAALAMVEGGAKGGESIVCTASVAASKGVAEQDDYTMSKHAVLGLVRSASCDLGKYGIRVNCVSPGSVATPMVVKGFGLKDRKSTEQKLSTMLSLKNGKALSENHVADAVLFLASDQSAFITGQNIIVDGGMA